LVSWLDAIRAPERELLTNLATLGRMHRAGLATVAVPSLPPPPDSSDLATIDRALADEAKDGLRLRAVDAAIEREAAVLFAALKQDVAHLRAELAAERRQRAQVEGERQVSAAVRRRKRPPSLKDNPTSAYWDHIDDILSLHKDYTIVGIARELGIGKSTVDKYLSIYRSLINEGRPATRAARAGMSSVVSTRPEANA
jgi:hypothetical protein